MYHLSNAWLSARVCQNDSQKSCRTHFSSYHHINEFDDPHCRPVLHPLATREGWGIRKRHASRIVMFSVSLWICSWWIPFDMGMHVGRFVRWSTSTCRSFLEVATSILLRDLRNASASGMVLVLKNSVLVRPSDCPGFIDQSLIVLSQPPVKKRITLWLEFGCGERQVMVAPCLLGSSILVWGCNVRSIKDGRQPWIEMVIVVFALFTIGSHLS